MLHKNYTLSYQFLLNHIDFKIVVFGFLDQKLGCFWLYNRYIQNNLSLLTNCLLCYIIMSANEIKLFKTTI